MKILYINTGTHQKNNNALLNYKNINFTTINHTNIDFIDLGQFDCVFSPCNPIDVKKYPYTKFIFGPHFSVFPNIEHMNLIQGNNTTYIQPSEWVVDLWKGFSICQNIRIKSLPFGVDTLKFIDNKNFNDKSNVFIYFKRRQPNELNFLINFLNKQNITFRIFDYINRYDETDFLNYLQNSKYGIMLDAHESQGFALQEALSCNVPLLVWNVTTLNQEYGSNYPSVHATTISYWDDRCGEYFTDVSQLETTFNKFITNLSEYKPREFILENLSIEKCEEKFINVVKSI